MIPETIRVGNSSVVIEENGVREGAIFRCDVPALLEDPNPRINALIPLKEDLGYVIYGEDCRRDEQRGIGRYMRSPIGGRDKMLQAIRDLKESVLYFVGIPKRITDNLYRTGENSLVEDL